MVHLLVALITLTNALLPVPFSGVDEFILFARNGILYANSIQTGEVTPLGTVSADFAAVLPGYDVYSLEAAHLTEAPPDGYGFHHGVWSPDRTRLAYVEIAPPRYRVLVQSDDGSSQLLLEDQLSAARGYLDPVGWMPNGEIVLLDRMLLNHLRAVNLWRLDPATRTLNYHSFVPVERLSGRTALLPDGVTIFLGYNVDQQAGYWLDLTNGQTRTFSALLGEILPPAHGFEYYPLQVFGSLSADDLAVVATQLQTDPAPEVLAAPQPFLHWPLADDQRSITCYPDSDWTEASFGVTCPGLSSPRDYSGHQGTDIGGAPDGLPLGTPVYPSAPGVVVAAFSDCSTDNPSCNHAYGNTVTLEHILVVEGETQVWYTGYGHLQTVLVEEGAYLDDLTVPLALSGATGDGGPHLHFEVRTTDRWVNPWDDRSGQALWVGGIEPDALVSADATASASQDLPACTSAAGNNIRSGPGLTSTIVGKTAQDVTYHVLETTVVADGDAPGKWYHVRFDGGEGWLWSGLLICP
ncbi:MAG TPA: M23 family metallopeptidase [Aggregatilinea sp.]|uniref:M23 family metallopeptidase n=1 Tax=Aggregatilinea sp. TaxID=2806333 RepID=UPI002BBC66CB|nr:M23 family metallopeptidase [Aggregatilinea sp.]HML20220.1 M23 family metallopeptidase [Aggregatilinea sp.]